MIKHDYKHNCYLTVKAKIVNKKPKEFYLQTKIEICKNLTINNKINPKNNKIVKYTIVQGKIFFLSL